MINNLNWESFAPYHFYNLGHCTTNIHTICIVDDVLKLHVFATSSYIDYFVQQLILYTSLT